MTSSEAERRVLNTHQQIGKFLQTVPKVSVKRLFIPSLIRLMVQNLISFSRRPSVVWWVGGTLGAGSQQQRTQKISHQLTSINLCASPDDVVGNKHRSVCDDSAFGSSSSSGRSGRSERELGVGRLAVLAMRTRRSSRHSAVGSVDPTQEKRVYCTMYNVAWCA